MSLKEQTVAAAASVKEDIEFRADSGVSLRGWVMTPDAEGPHATIVMTPGFSSSITRLEAVADAFAPAEVDQASRSRLLRGTGHVVPAGRVRRPRVEQGAPEHVHFILVREPGLLAAPQRGENGREGDLGDPVDPALGGDDRLNGADGRPQPGIVLRQMDLAVLLEPRRHGDDLRVRAFPVVHPLLTGLIGTHPQRDR